jgi:hypothetical protein
MKVKIVVIYYLPDIMIIIRRLKRKVFLREDGTLFKDFFQLQKPTLKNNKAEFL